MRSGIPERGKFQALKHLPAGISYEVLSRWLERLENGQEIWRELEAEPAHVVDVPGTTIESLLRRRPKARQADTSPALPRRKTS